MPDWKTKNRFRRMKNLLRSYDRIVSSGEALHTKDIVLWLLEEALSPYRYEPLDEETLIKRAREAVQEYEKKYGVIPL
ncbi:MAG: hypothetical protein JRI44_12185 [Deltaproteobacteria bacterium]|nr:hypothetical protein [Deltaproteobacteria bacterium]